MADIKLTTDPSETIQNLITMATRRLDQNRGLLRGDLSLSETLAEAIPGMDAQKVQYGLLDSAIKKLDKSETEAINIRLKNLVENRKDGQKLALVG